MSETLVCPKCKNIFVEKEKSLKCDICNITVNINGKLYDFMGNSNYYWNEISPTEMEETLNIAINNGWRAAIKKIGINNHQLFEYILSEKRSDWIYHCINFSKTNSCLDIGSGWGTNAFSLAKYYGEVWSLEAVKQRIEFQKIRQEQDNINNIKFVRTDWLHLPFKNDYFDLVIANGVLEWVGLSDYSKNPRDLQIDFLKEIRRVLKPGGCLYIGIENRYKLQAFLGERDHSDLPFTSIMPRKIADIIVRLSDKAGYYRQHGKMEKWNDYRTYTYSKSGYNKLLQEAKYKFIDFYWTLSYNMPDISGKFNDISFHYYLEMLRQAYNIQGKSNLSKLLIYLSMFFPDKLLSFINQLICSSFLIYAYKEIKEYNFENKLINSRNFNGSYFKISGGNSTNSKINYFLYPQEGLFSVLKFSRKRNSLLAGEEKLIADINKIDIRTEEIDSIPIFIEPILKGNHPQPCNIIHNTAILKWLINFQKKTRKGIWDYDKLEANILEISSILPLIVKNDPIQSRIQNRINKFLQSLKSLKIPITSEHGDFSNINIIINENKLYVLDWEFYNDNGDPFFDCLFYILNNLAIRKIDSISKYIKLKNQMSRDLIEPFSQEYDFPAECVLQAFPYVILRCIYRSYVGENNRHLNFPYYYKMLELWDKIDSIEEKYNNL